MACTQFQTEFLVMTPNLKFSMIPGSMCTNENHYPSVKELKSNQQVNANVSQERVNTESQV